MQEAMHKTQRLTVHLKKVGYTIIRAHFIIKADAIKQSFIFWFLGHKMVNLKDCKEHVWGHYSK